MANCRWKMSWWISTSSRTRNEPTGAGAPLIRDVRMSGRCNNSQDRRHRSTLTGCLIQASFAGVGIFETVSDEQYLNRSLRLSSIRLSRTPLQKTHRQPRPNPRTNRGEAHVHPVARVADDREGRQQIPDTAPGCSRQPPSRSHRRAEHNVHGVRRRSGQHDSQSQPCMNLPHGAPREEIVRDDDYRLPRAERNCTPNPSCTSQQSSFTRTGGFLRLTGRSHEDIIEVRGGAVW